MAERRRKPARELHDLAELELDDANPNRGTVRGRKAVEQSLRRLGAGRSVVVDRDGKVIAGNKTVEKAREIGLPMRVVQTAGQELVVVQRTDLALDSARGRELAVADNRTGELGLDWDTEVMAALEARGDVDLTQYFDREELDAILDRDWTAGEDAPVPEPPDTPVTRTGDLWILGKHRLLCGDSGDADAVDRLLGGAPVHLVNTDPPYNVKVEPRSNNAIAAGLSSFPATKSAVEASDARGMHHQGFDLARHKSKSRPTGKMRAKDRPLANDFITDDAFDALLLAWFGNMARVLIPGRAFYIWGGYSNWINYPPAIKASGLYFSQGIIWVKEHPILTRKDYMGNHECCFYGWREGAAHQFFGPTNATDVWPVKKVNPQSMVHLTEKPVELAERAIRYSTKRGEHVLDLFGGSGSTLIGAERSERRSFLMEMDTAYCDVIIKRWQVETGRQAVLEESGATFDAVAAERGIAGPDGQE